MSASSAAFSQLAGNSKQLTNLHARFALLGHELHTITKGDQAHYEVRRWGQCRTCSTLHDLEGFLSVLRGRS
jgi:hypothetical protein